MQNNNNRGPKIAAPVLRPDAPYLHDPLVSMGLTAKATDTEVAALAGMALGEVLGRARARLNRQVLGDVAADVAAAVARARTETVVVVDVEDGLGDRREMWLRLCCDARGWTIEAGRTLRDPSDMWESDGQSRSA